MKSAIAQGITLNAIVTTPVSTKAILVPHTSTINVYANTGRAFMLSPIPSAYARAALDSRYMLLLENHIKEGSHLTQSDREALTENYQRLRELAESIFDKDGYFTDKIRPMSIETKLLTVGSKSDKMTMVGVLFSVNVNGDPNLCGWSDGIIWHFALPDDSGATWELEAGSFSMEESDKVYYIYVVAPKSQLGRATMLVTKDKLATEAGEHFNILAGVVHSVYNGVRKVTFTYGQTTIVGENITTGRIKGNNSNGLIIDLNTGEISGKITFLPGSPALTDINGAKQAAQEASSSVESLGSYIEGAFRDGVVDTAEAKAIEKYKAQVVASFNNLIAAYNVLYINPYLEGTPKTNLLNSKITLIAAKDALLSSITDAIVDGCTTPAEKSAVDAKFQEWDQALSDYNSKLEMANRAIQDKLKSFSDGASEAAQAAQQAASSAISSAAAANSAVSDLGSYVEGSFKDGVISETEAITIGTFSKQVDNEYSTAINDYNVVFANPFISGTAKQELLNAKISWSGAKDALQSSISLAIADGKTTSAEKLDFESKFASYSQAYRLYQTALSNANRAIQERIKGYSDEAAQEAAKALSQLSDMASDGMLSPVEKKDLVQRYGNILAEQQGLSDQAESLGVTDERDSYNAAITSLTDYLNTLLTPVAWSSLSGSTEINRDAFYPKFNAVYAARQALINRMFQGAKDGAERSAKDTIAKNLGYANFDELNSSAINGKTIVEGGKIRNNLIDTDALFAKEIMAKNMVVLGGKVGDFEIASKLIGRGFTNGIPNGNQVVLDPYNNEVVLSRNGVKRVRLTNSELTAIGHLKVDGGTIFCESGSASPVRKSSVLALFASRNDVGVGGDGVSRTVAVGVTSSTPSVFNVIAEEAKLSLQPAFYSIDLPYAINIVHSGDQHDGRFDRITGKNTCEVEVSLVKSSGVVSTYKDAFDISVDTLDTGRSVPFNRMARFNFPVSTADKYWMVVKFTVKGGERPIRYQSFNHGTWLRNEWWAEEYDWDVQYELSVNAGMSVDGSIGITEISNSGFQSVWTNHRYIRVDGNTSNPVFIESEGVWMHNGVEVKFDKNTITGYIDPTVYATRNYVDTGFVRSNGGTVAGDLTITGNLYLQQDGKYIVTEKVYSENDFITLRYNNPSLLAQGAYTGFEAKKVFSDGSDGYLVYGNDGMARVGKLSSLQTLATREDSPLDDGMAVWSTASKRFNSVAKGAITVGNADKLGGVPAAEYGRRWYDGWVSVPGYDANTIGASKSGFTYSNNAPYNGPIVRFDAGGYDLELSSSYYSNDIAFRTRNGDVATWNSWRSLWHNGNLNLSSIDFRAKDLFVYGYLYTVNLLKFTGLTGNDGFEIYQESNGNLGINANSTTRAITISFDGSLTNVRGNLKANNGYQVWDASNLNRDDVNFYAKDLYSTRIFNSDIIYGDIRIEDTRNIAIAKPYDVKPYSVQWDFKPTDVTGTPSWDYWTSILTIKGWTGSYSAAQVLFPASDNNSKSLYYRTGINDTWNELVSIWTGYTLNRSDVDFTAKAINAYNAVNILNGSNLNLFGNGADAGDVVFLTNTGAELARIYNAGDKLNFTIGSNPGDIRHSFKSDGTAYHYSVQSNSYSGSGFTANGWKVGDYSNLLNLDVRGRLQVYEFVQNKISILNGNAFFTENAKASSYNKSIDGNGKHIQYVYSEPHPFNVGDYIRVKTATKDFIERVDWISTDRLLLSCWAISDYTYDNVGATDLAVRWNSEDVNRKGLIYINSSDTNNPNIQVIYDNTVKAQLGNVAGLNWLGSALPANTYGVWVDNGYFNGAINANSGKIANFNITDNILYAGAAYGVNDGVSGVEMRLSTNSWGRFLVHNGYTHSYAQMYSSNDGYYGLEIKKNGVVIAHLGDRNNIAGWTLNQSKIYNDPVYIDAANKAVWISKPAGGHVMLGQTYVGGWTGKYGFSATNSSGQELIRIDDEVTRLSGWNFTHEEFSKYVGNYSVVLNSASGIVGTYKLNYGWTNRLNRDGSGMLARDNISWDDAGNVSFTDNVKVQWEAYSDNNLCRYKNRWRVGNGADQLFDVGSGGANGSTNTYVLGNLPNGTRGTVLRMQGTNSDGGNGGWNWRFPNIDTNFTYRYAVWVYKEGAGGRIYHGCDNGGQILTINGNNDYNPYFYHWTFSNMLNGWYLIVGYVHYAGYSSSNVNPRSDAGVYNIKGEKVDNAISDFKWNYANSIISATFRSYLYYGGDNAYSYFYAPALHKCDGSEPTIRQMVDTATGRTRTTQIDANGIYTGTLTAQQVLATNAVFSSANIADASITSAKIASLDVSKLTGDIISGKIFINRNASNIRQLEIGNGNIYTYTSTGAIASQMNLGELKFFDTLGVPSLFLKNSAVTLAGVSSGNSFTVAAVGTINNGQVVTSSSFYIDSTGLGSYYATSSGVTCQTSAAYTHTDDNSGYLVTDKECSSSTMVQVMLERQNAGGGWDNMGTVGSATIDASSDYALSCGISGNQTVSLAYTITQSGTYRYRFEVYVTSWAQAYNPSYNWYWPTVVSSESGYFSFSNGFSVIRLNNGTYVGINGITSYNKNSGTGEEKYFSVDTSQESIVQVKGLMRVNGCQLTDTLLAFFASGSPGYDLYIQRWTGHSVFTSKSEFQLLRIGGGQYRLTHNLYNKGLITSISQYMIEGVAGRYYISYVDKNLNYVTIVTSDDDSTNDASEIFVKLVSTINWKVS